jgi:hypothetical protein
MDTRMEIDEKIRKVIKRIDDVKSRWPFHSPKPAMFRELEELEEELAELQKKKNTRQF